MFRESPRKADFDSPARVALNAGDQTLHVWNRNDGFRLDEIVLSQMNNAPTGQGSVGSARANTP
jgi:hypothetical protein